MRLAAGLRLDPLGRGRRTSWGKKGWEGEGRKGERVGKWERRLDLDISPGAPELPVTPLTVATEAKGRELFARRGSTLSRFQFQRE